MIRIIRISFSPLILCLLLFGSPSHAIPTLQWNPGKLSIEQMQGTQSTHTVTVTATENGQDIVIQSVPALQKWLVISPRSLRTLQKGQSIELVIAINIPSNEPVGVYDGVIELKQQLAGQPRKTLAKPLPIKLAITPFVNSGLPPDPGEAGKQTLLGIDSDGDGVRDDVQRYIALTYPDEPKVRAALTQFANQYQGLLPQADDRDAAYNHAVKLMRHLDCLVGIKGEDFIKISPALRAVILNTRQRSLAYIKFSDNLGGQQITSTPLKEWKTACAFDVDAVGGVQ
jgi:hypothetical protein